MESKSDFSKGNVNGIIIRLAIPLILAQLVQVLYNVVDRIYIGHMENIGQTALTGMGIVFPIILIIGAFTNLFGTGGAPLCSIERGKGNEKRAEKIMGNTFAMLIYTSILLMLVFYIFMKPFLYLFGASNDTYSYAYGYFSIYLMGTPFFMIGTGMSGFINCQGYTKIAMAATVSGAVVNIILDPVFIYTLNMGVKGAAVATVISQIISAVLVMGFLFSKKTLLKIRKENLKIEIALLKKITGLGAAGFIMSASTGLVQITANSTLKATGGDVYVGIMTVINSIRDVVILPTSGFTQAVQPVIGFNLGARKYNRISQAIRFVTIFSVIYMIIAWALLFFFPESFIRIFNSNPELIAKGVPALHTFFFGMFMMSLQVAGQAVFVGMGYSKHAIFFSLLRKVIIVIPLTLILPYVWN